MNYNKEIIRMLSLSSFFKDNTNIKDNAKYLLFEPIIFDELYKNPKKSKILSDDIKNILNKDISSAETIITSLIQEKSICIQRDLLSISDEESVRSRLDKYISIKNEHTNIWNKITETYLNTFDGKDVHKLTVDKDFYLFFNKIFDNKNGEVYDSDVRISLFLEDCYTKNEKYLNVIQNIIQGLAITKSFGTNEDLSMQNNKPTIYCCNRFIGHTFGWCSDIKYKTAKLILKILKEHNFEIKIHDITLEALIDSINSYRNTSPQNVRPNTYFYDMKLCGNNKDAFCVDIMNRNDIYSSTREKIKDIGIKSIDQIKNISVDTNDELYKKINKSRNKIYANTQTTEYDDNLNQSQTKYDYKIIKNYNMHQHTNEDVLVNMREMFLTNQYPIYHNVLYTSGRLYEPIMSVQRFFTAFLLGNIMDNYNKNLETIKTIILNKSIDILDKKVSKFLADAIDKKISDEDRRLLIAYASENIEDNNNLKHIEKDNWDVYATLTRLHNLEKKTVELETEHNSLKEQFKTNDSEQKKINAKQKRQLKNLENKLENRDKIIKSIIMVILIVLMFFIFNYFFQKYFDVSKKITSIPVFIIQFIPKPIYEFAVWGINKILALIPTSITAFILNKMYDGLLNIIKNKYKSFKKKGNTK